ncbi:MAG: radical SAM protein [Desulfuromonadaceae bacterium]
MFDSLTYVPPVFRPPSEANSLIIQATVGCSQNQCTFCGMYKTKRFYERDLDDILAELENLPRRERGLVRRVFIGDGDGLVYTHKNLMALLEALADMLPNLNRVGAYASPRSLSLKSKSELEELRARKLRIIYFGLESGDNRTLELANKGYDADSMLKYCHKAKNAGLKISVTAILGLAGRARSAEHARATAAWINSLSPAYFSLLTLFRRHNDKFFTLIDPLSNGEILEEACSIVERLQPQKTILRSNHVSNILNLAGTYPKDRKRLIDDCRTALMQARCHPDWFNSVPAYCESYY